MEQFTKTCISCRPVDKAEEQRTILTTQYCRVVLRTDDQSWLGRCIIVPKRHINSFRSLTKEEEEDIRNCRIIVGDAYKALFHMTYDNWLQLGNLTRDHDGKETDDERYFHIHFHLIPRYRKPAVWNKKEFPDAQFGKALNIDPDSGHKKLVLDKEAILDLRNTIRAQIVTQLHDDGEAD